MLTTLLLPRTMAIHLFLMGIGSGRTSFAVHLRGASTTRCSCTIHHTIRHVIRLTTTVAVISHAIDTAVDRHPIGIRLYLNRIGKLEQSLTIQAIRPIACDIALFQEGKQ